MLNINDIIVENSFSGNSLSAVTIFSGSTNINIENLLAYKTHSHSQYSVLSGSNEFIGEVTAPSLSATTISGETLYSGSTNLYDIFLTTNDGNDITRVQPGSNITTGGTGNLPIVNVVDSPSFNSITASGASSFTTLSATTFISGSTNLYDIFLTAGDLSGTSVSAGSNVDVVNNGNDYKVSVVGSPSFNNLSFSGTATGGNVFANNVSGATLFSGSTNLYDIFLTTADGNDITRVGNGLNTYTGGTDNNPTVNVSALTISTLSVSGSTSLGILSASTIYSGSTNLYDIFLTSNDGNDITRVQPGSNITTGGTANNPIINLVDSPSVNNISFSGIATGGNVFATNISGSTLYSGSTNLYDIFLTTNDGNDITRVQNGLNAYTGGTANNPTVNVSGLTIDYITVSGVSSFNSLSANTLYSGSTNLYDIFLTTNDGNDITRVQPGSNITTGGTANEPIVSLVDSPSINNLSFSGTATGGNVFANNLSGSTLYSGSTNLYDIFLTSSDGNDITRVQPGLNTYTGGTENLPTINISAATLNGLSVSGVSSLTTVFSNLVAASTATTTYFSSVVITGETIYSGSTNLYDIFLTTADGNDITRVQPGSNITTGGTGNNPIVNVVSSPNFNSITASGASSFTTLSASTIISGSTDLSSLFANKSEINLINSQLPTKANLSGATFNGIVNAPTLSAATISGGTLYSGSTNLYDIFLTTNDGNDITRVQPGSNITTGGTANNPIINLVDSPSVDNISFSGTATGGNVFATNISGSTLYSGSTNLYDIFLTTNDGNDITRVSNGLNTYTGGTANEPTVNVSGLTIDNINVSGNSIFNTLSATLISGGTLYSGSTNLYDIFLTSNDGNDITRVQPGSNITTGGTENNPIVSLADSPSINNLSFSGTATGGDVFANNVSGGTLYSGSTNLYDIFITTNDGNDITRVENGLNTYTGGTANNPTVNVSGLTIDNITVSGISSFNSLSANTIYSGNTNLYDIFLTTNDGNDITRVQPGSNITTGGTANNPIVSLVESPSINNLSFSGVATGGDVFATNISGSTLYSGSTNLYDIFLTSNDGNDITRVGNGLNTYTGGTVNNPTVNVSGLTINNISVSGISSFNSVSATTYYSGSTNIYDIFLTSGELSGTSVSAGSNVDVVNNGNDYKVSVVGSPSFNNLSFSGTATGGDIFATTLSAGTIFSGSTNLYSIFQRPISLQNGINTFTGGTPFLPSVNLTALTVNNITVTGTSVFAAVTATTVTATTINATVFSGGTFYGSASGLTGIAGGAIQTSLTAATTTTVSNDLLLEGMSAITVTGQYLILFSGVFSTSNNNAIISISVYVNGAQIPSSLRPSKFGSNKNETSIIERITAEPGSLIEIRWNTTAGTATSDQRTLILL